MKRANALAESCFEAILLVNATTYTSQDTTDVVQAHAILRGADPNHRLISSLLEYPSPLLSAGSDALPDAYVQKSEHRILTQCRICRPYSTKTFRQNQQNCRLQRACYIDKRHRQCRQRAPVIFSANLYKATLFYILLVACFHCLIFRSLLMRKYINLYTYFVKTLSPPSQPYLSITWVLSFNSYIQNVRRLVTVGTAYTH